MSTVIFAGPSLHGVDLAAFASFDFRPPAKRGDILSAVDGGARRIGLIDGVFGDIPSVWHKEILHGLSQGIVIAGAASMGALRAAECAAFGMVGIGRIWRDYIGHRRVADSDVALVHAPAPLDYAPMTLPLVDAQATIEAVRAAGVLAAETCVRLQEAAETLHYSLRTWDTVISAAGLAISEAEAVHMVVLAKAVSVKALDALELLQSIEMLEPAADPDWKLSSTVFFDALRREIHGS